MPQTEVSTWQIVYKFLKENKIDVYAPAQHIGECKKPYVVLRDGGTSKFNGFSSTANILEVLCYVPQSEFSKLEFYVAEVEFYMSTIIPQIMIRPTYFKTPSFYDEQVKGHMVSVQYEVYKQVITTLNT